MFLLKSQYRSKPLLAVAAVAVGAATVTYTRSLPRRVMNSDGTYTDLSVKVDRSGGGI